MDHLDCFKLELFLVAEATFQSEEVPLDLQTKPFPLGISPPQSMAPVSEE